MKGVAEAELPRVGPGEAGRPATRGDARAARVACYHCGQPCGRDGLALEGKPFCCLGCQTVYSLLTATGLGQFYELAPAPGARVVRTARREQWTYLDDPAVQEPLLDFGDERRAKVTFHLPAIHCVACVWLLENLFRLHPGIGSSPVNFARREVAITFARSKIKLSELVALLAALGYEPLLTLGELERRGPNPARRRQWLQLGIAGFAFGNIMLFSLPRYLGLDSFSGPHFQLAFGCLSLALAVPVLVYSALDFWQSAWLSARRRALTLDVPIALGLAALYAQSACEIASGRGEGYLDSLAALVFFLLCGRVFQQKTHERLAFDRDYKSFFPLAVTRTAPAGRPLPAADLCPDGAARGVARPAAEQRVSVSQLQVGDRILIRNGELIPADAKLVSGPALIDYSFVTGESEPVAKAADEHLYAGGRQVGGAIEVKTVKPVSQSYLASLWSHEAFQKNRDDSLNTLTNRYSRRFTRIVIAVAAGAALCWTAAGDGARGIKAFTSVLIVACPCALALAAPLTLGTAQRWLARRNVFLKNALVLERLAQADAIVFDKTGTLTAAGASSVAFDGAPLRAAEANWICSLTCHSTHPHSVRISESLAERTLPEPVQAFRETPGCGLEGRVQGRDIWVGSGAWLESRGVRPQPSAQREQGRDGESAAAGAAHPAALHGSAVHVAIGGRYRGAFAMSSVLRPETDRLLRQLGGRCEIALLSGDNERERERFRALFGADARLHFNQSPLDKLGFIRRLQESGRTVIMVGDGLNDAGALKQSDVGVAVVENIGAFSPASDVIVEAGQVPRLADLLTLARRSARIVRLSFGLSALYNVIGVSIAAAGVLSPVICAVLMPVSSVSVVLFACGATTWAARRAGLVGGASSPSTRAGSDAGAPGSTVKATA